MKKVSPSSFSRRTFLGISAAIPAAIAAGVPAQLSAADRLAGIVKKNDEASDGPAAPGPLRKRRIGLELYSVRGELGKDLPKTLQAVAEMGYEVVEFYSPYFKWKPTYAKGVRAQLDDLGMRCYSTHNGMESFSTPEGLAHAVELNQILGCRYLILASAGGAKGVEGWKGLGEKLSAVVEKLAPHGLAPGYHNHGAEWAKLENGQRIMEVIAANTPKEFVLQLDVGTCVESGADPVAWVKANPGRIKVMHLKDWGPGEGKGYRVLFGEGATPWKELMGAAESVGGLEYFLIEQEGSRYSEFETAKKCLDNYKQMFGPG